MSIDPFCLSDEMHRGVATKKKTPTTETMFLFSAVMLSLAYIQYIACWMPFAIRWYFVAFGILQYIVIQYIPSMIQLSLLDRSCFILCSPDFWLKGGRVGCSLV